MRRKKLVSVRFVDDGGHTAIARQMKRGNWDCWVKASGQMLVTEKDTYPEIVRWMNRYGINWREVKRSEYE